MNAQSYQCQYVPTEADELGRTDIVAAYAGGMDGREVIDQFLPLVPVRFTHSHSLLTSLE